MELPSPHNLPFTINENNILKTRILTAYFYGNIVVVEADEGVTLSYTTAFSILVAGLKRLGNRPFVYVTNRVNSYSVNPNDYVYLEKIPTLKGIAIVAPNDLVRRNAQLELNFCKKPMKIFESLIDSVEWSEQLLSGDK